MYVTIVGIVVCNSSIDPYKYCFQIQNQMGEDWGERGFAKIEITGGWGLCGINVLGLYPDVELLN